MKMRSLLAALLLVVFSSAVLEAQNHAAARGAQLPQLRAQLQQHLQRNQVKDAIADLRRILDVVPTDGDARANLGVMLYFDHQFQASLPELRMALAERKKLWKLQALLGLAELHTGDEASARTDLSTALPNLTEEKLQSEVAFALTDSYMRSGDAEHAVQALTALLAAQPTNRLALYRSYRIYADLADRSLITLAMSAPASAELHISMARELARQHMEESAITNFKQAIELDPQYPGLHTEYAHLLFSSTDANLREQARGELAIALAQNDNDEQAHLLMGLVESRASNEAAAKLHFEQALHLAPNDADACNELAKIEAANGDKQRAISLFERVVAADPSNYLAHYRLSTLYRQSGRQDEARKEAEAYLKYKKMAESVRAIFDKLKLGTLTAHDDEEQKDVR